MKKIFGQRGDTLIEVMLAMTILSLTLVSAFAIANRASRLGREAKERVAAVNIAQEQIEALRNYRAANKWNPTIGDISAKGSPIYMRKSGSAWTVESGSLFGHPTLPDSQASISWVTSPDQLDITVTVSWPGVGPVPNETKVYTRLVNLEKF